ncbi:MAG: hypothetical protein K2Z81_02705 [Cyanobacteria bacterium]|nr:hypothetical protein [Cyanobacteriota bacterium]
MGILIGKYEFDGPYSTVADLQEKPGLYVVLHYERDEYELIHVSQADNIRASIEVSPSAYTQTRGSIFFAAHYTSGCGTRDRGEMVEEIHFEFDALERQECTKQQTR